MQRQDSLEMLAFPCYHNIDSIHPKIHNNLKTDQLESVCTIDHCFVASAFALRVTPVQVVPSFRLVHAMLAFNVSRRPRALRQLAFRSVRMFPVCMVVCDCPSMRTTCILESTL